LLTRFCPLSKKTFSFFWGRQARFGRDNKKGKKVIGLRDSNQNTARDFCNFLKYEKQEKALKGVETREKTENGPREKQAADGPRQFARRAKLAEETGAAGAAEA
jgi:hypothetical protein